MEIKINFDQLFRQENQDLNTTLETPSQSYNNNSSDTHSLNTTIEYQYTLNKMIFDNKQAEIEDLNEQISPQPINNKKPKHIKQIKHNNSRASQPGERLYYESQQQLARKTKEIEKIKQDKIVEITKMNTFIPTINEKSRALAQKGRQQKQQGQKTKKQAVFKSTVQLKQEQDLKQCTFKPTLIAKNKQTQYKSSEELFYYLHNTNKIKDMKIQSIAQQNDPHKNHKKGTQAQVNSFLRRNEQFSNKVMQKQKLLIKSSAQYDLNTGEKLFSPKIIPSKLSNHYFASNKTPVSQSSVKSINKDDYNSTIRQEDYLTKVNKNRGGIFGKKKNIENFMEKGEQLKLSELSELKRQAKLTKLEQLKRIDEESRLLQKQIGQNYYQYAMAMQKHFSPYQNQPNQYSPPIIQEQQVSMPQTFSNEDKNHNIVNQQEQQQQGWQDNDLKPIELSDVNRYLNASEEDQNEKHNSNCVMDILNNLLIKQQQ